MKLIKFRSSTAQSDYIVGGQQGVALLAVLWLSMALTIMGLTTAYLVRTETKIISNEMEATRGYFLARGGLEAALFAITRPSTSQSRGAEIDPSYEFRRGQHRMNFEFADGSVIVQVMPENAKLNVNRAQPSQLAALFAVLGATPSESIELANAIVDWRSPDPSPLISPWDLFYASLPEPYEAPHRPFDELEELIAVKGMSQELFFGRLTELPDGSWKKIPPLADLLTTEPIVRGVNINHALREILLVLPGWNEGMAAAVIETREREPITSLAVLQMIFPEMSGTTSLSRVTVSDEPIYTLTATGFPSASAVARTVRARVRVGREYPLSHHILAWWDDWPWVAWLPGEGNQILSESGDSLI